MNTEWRWYLRPRWLALHGRGEPNNAMMIASVRSLALAFGKPAARRAVLDAESEWKSHPRKMRFDVPFPTSSRGEES